MTTDWGQILRTEHRGETGLAFWKTLEIGNIRVRMVEYSPNYFADHWCSRGHVLLVLEGKLLTELNELFRDRQVVLARELTKKFEEFLRGSPAELLVETRKRSLKGEFVVMIGPSLSDASDSLLFSCNST